MTYEILITYTPLHNNSNRGHFLVSTRGHHRGKQHSNRGGNQLHRLLHRMQRMVQSQNQTKGSYPNYG